MKKILNLITLLLVALTVSSCAFNKSTGSLKISLPSKAVRAADSAQIEISTYEVALTTSDSATLSKSVKPEEPVYFDNLPLGPAKLSITAYDTAETPSPCYSGSVELVITPGENTVNIPLKPVEGYDQTKPITLTLKYGNQTKEFVVNKNFDDKGFIDAINEAQQTVFTTESGITKYFAFWRTGKGKKIKFYDGTKSIIPDFLNSLKEDTVLEAKYGMSMDYYSDYIKEAKENEEIIFLKNGMTKIPSVTVSADQSKGLTLDFSECTSLTSIDASAFTQQSTNKFVDNLILPHTITVINGIKGVKKAVYISSKTQNLSFGQNVTDTSSSVASYGIIFDGTLADWCSKVSVGTGSYTYSNYPLPNLAFFQVLKDDEFVDVKGKELNIEPSFTDSDGTAKTLTTIPKYAFYKFPCSSITIPDTVAKIEERAFEECTATKVIIGANVKVIEAAALYYSNSTTERKVYYNNTINSWMKIGCKASGSSSSQNDGGPFIKGKNSFYVKNNGTYVPAITNGKMSIEISKYIKYEESGTEYGDISGQLQGIQGLQTLIITCPNDDEEYSISDNAFYNCLDLTEVICNARVSLGNKIFDKTKLNTLTLSNTKGLSEKNSDTFYYLNDYQIYVPDTLLTAYVSSWGEDFPLVSLPVASSDSDPGAPDPEDPDDSNDENFG